MAAVLEEAGTAGWVLPFLGHGQRVELVLQQPVERLHPGLAGHLRASRRSPAGTVAAATEPMTPRERTILELLPSHLSYAEIGSRLYCR